MHEAAQRHVPLTVMTVRPEEVRPATQIFWGVRDTAEQSFDPDHARTLLREFVDKAADEAGEKPEITVSVVMGDVAEELLKAARDADMLVVGSRGGGSFAKLLLGSVSSKVTHHAVGPVVVVPEPG
jgi:nucleotide-binding universal stress UspA family protein